MTVCARCVVDRSVPGARFDAAGVCSYCHLHDEMDRAFPTGAAGRARVARMAERVRREGAGRPFDCVAGLSGGRDSTYTLWYLVRELGLRPVAVHFNDGFGNPVAGENMARACTRLGVELRTVTSDWRESKDLKRAFLAASTPDLEEGTDLGIAAALYGAAAGLGLRTIVFGQSFRTEGICPLEWNFLDGRYLHAVHARFGTVPLRPWREADPGFNLRLRHLAWYTLGRRIRTEPLLYHLDYVRADTDALLTRELDWENPGAHYFDDLYQAFMTWVLRTKFGCDRRRFNYGALVRSGQMDRTEALDRLAHPSVIEDEAVITLCWRRLGLDAEELATLLAAPPRTFRDYPSSWPLLRALQGPIWAASRLGIVPGSTYAKYFRCG